MNARQHLYLDCFIQFVLLLYFGFLMGKAENFFELLAVIPFVFLAWQLPNGLIYDRFFEQHSRRTFLKYSFYTIILIAAFWGLIWMAFHIPGLYSFLLPVVTAAIPLTVTILPFLAGIIALGYLGLCFRDLYFAVYKTI
ncbi:hypothetical protein PPO43_07930 [Saprospira sp. CCB-QB6]|uniref:hypothetical protein n=1 Tax=Saprospira sp. CCB-QB6 TaxID=3023936 RepID=UPI00234B9A0B|nr:hypothetical protein [Saprospira sp. CCB-QB6]WCL83014.1 hypothetical protein PPO43_07930 [Saprospira sp. CCB-QB6]